MIGVNGMHPAFALAPDFRFEHLAGLVVDSLILARRDSTFRFDALSPNQRNRGVVRKTLPGLEDHNWLVHDEIRKTFQQDRAIGAAHDRRADSLRYSFHRKAGMLENRVLVRFRVEHQHERLLLIYVVALGPRPLIDYGRAARVEVKRAQICERIAG